MNFLLAQETSTNTAIEQNFVNPLPKDKFVFLEIREEMTTVLPMGSFLPEPEISPCYDGYIPGEKTIELFSEDKKINENTVLLIHQTVVLLDAPGWDYSIYRIDKLPFIFFFRDRFFGTEIYKFLPLSYLTFKFVDEKVNIYCEYGDQKIEIKPKEIFSVNLKKEELSNKKQKQEIKRNVKIIHHGILEKSKIKKIKGIKGDRYGEMQIIKLED
jgi:hypothetical protein